MGNRKPLLQVEMQKYVEIAGDRLQKGDQVFVRAEGDPNNTKPFIAKILGLEPDPDNGGYRIKVQWFYRPEDPGIPGGRKAFHGERELYVSDHHDMIHSSTLLGRCVVHTLEDYHKLDIIRPQDYFSRFSFSIRSRKFHPESVTVYCRCQLPENPDRAMSQCDECGEWLHPECCGTTVEAIEAAPTWQCPDCEQKHRSAAGMATGWVPIADASGLAQPQSTDEGGLLKALQQQLAAQQQRHMQPAWPASGPTGGGWDAGHW